MKKCTVLSVVAIMGALAVLLWRFSDDDEKASSGRTPKTKQAGRGMADSVTPDSVDITHRKERRQRDTSLAKDFTESDFKMWLAGKKGDVRTSAEAGAIVGLITGNPDLIRQAIEADPKNPLLLYIGATHSSFTREEHLKHSEAFFLQDESNALAAYIYAAQLFQSGDTKKGIEILSHSQDRPRIDSFASQIQLLMDEAYGAAGCPPQMAKIQSILNLGIPFYSQLQSMADSINTLSNTMPPEEAANLRALAASMGMRLNQQSGMVTFVDHLIGLKLEEKTLAGLSNDSPSPYTGMTVEQVRQAITKEREDLIRVIKHAPLEDVISSPSAVVDGYIDRLRLSGELEATKWWMETTGVQK